MCLFVLLCVLPATAEPSSVPAGVALTRHPDARVAIVAHRGANRVAPENTFAAAWQCVVWQVDYLEVDVRTSRDGVLYVIHDATLDRTTNGTGLVREHTAAELDQLDAGSWFAPAYAGERIPRLETMLRWAKGRIRVYLDVKDAPLDQLINLVERTGMSNQVFFWFGDKDAAREFSIVAPHLPLKINVGSTRELVKAKERFNARIVEVGPVVLTPQLIREAAALDMSVMAYVPEGNEDDFRHAIRLGAPLVNLNHAQRFIQLEREFLESQPTSSSP
jgi:glycerophosphoryl diester phosphodiesterase